MKFRLALDESVESSVRRITTALVDHALEQINGKASDETIHEARKDCKKVRSVLRLFRSQFPDTYRTENAAFRDAAAALSDIRDAQAMIECFDGLMARYEPRTGVEELASIRNALLDHKEHRKREVAGQRLEDFRRRMPAARDRIQQWSLPDDSFAGVAGGLGRTYRRGRRAMVEAYADPSAERFHEWRKRAKYLWHHTSLLRDLWPPVMNAYRDELKRLSETLGEDHDLAVLGDLLVQDIGKLSDESRVQALIGLIGRRSVELRDEARTLGHRIYAERPKAFCERLGNYWPIARDQEGAGHDPVKPVKEEGDAGARVLA